MVFMKCLIAVAILFNNAVYAGETTNRDKFDGSSRPISIDSLERVIGSKGIEATLEDLESSDSQPITTIEEQSTRLRNLRLIEIYKAALDNYNRAVNDRNFLIETGKKMVAQSDIIQKVVSEVKLSSYPTSNSVIYFNIAGGFFLAANPPLLYVLYVYLCNSFVNFWPDLKGSPSEIYQIRGNDDVVKDYLINRLVIEEFNRRAPKL